MAQIAPGVQIPEEDQPYLSPSNHKPLPPTALVTLKKENDTFKNGIQLTQLYIDILGKIKNKTLENNFLLGNIF